MPALVVVLVLAIAAAALAGALGWYSSSRLKASGLSARRESPVLDLIVRAVTADAVTLEMAADNGREGLGRGIALIGLAWEGGYGRLGTPLESSETSVRREFELLEGGLSEGTRARVDTFAFPGDPTRAFGLPFEEVMIHGPLGEMPAWFVDAPETDCPGVWAILVHGQGTDRREVLRQLPAIHGAGLRALLVTFRNDEGAPPSVDGNYRYGATEWEDIEAAAVHAIEHGAERLLLVGQSMGGGIVMSFLYHSPLAEHVRAVVLDSPMLDFRATVQWRAPGVPAAMIRGGMWVAGRRFRYDWRELDYLRRAPALSAPILLVHGDADTRVPFSTSEALAKARPDIVTFVRMPGIGHVRGWNADPQAYEAKVSQYLASQFGSPVARP